VKIEGSNFNTMIIALNAFVSCDILGLEESYQGICFGHAFSKFDDSKKGVELGMAPFLELGPSSTPFLVSILNSNGIQGFNLKQPIYSQR
jgi:hypothetical protein